MAKRIVWICVILLICVGIYYSYQHYQERKFDTDVVCLTNCDTPEQKAAFARENAVDSADGQTDRRKQSASQNAANDAAGSSPDGSFQPAAPTQTSTTNMGQPLVARTNQTSQTGQQSAGTAATGTTASASSVAPSALPVSDSQPANAPNGMRFTSSNGFQWYRQGNLTWRQNPSTGESCIAYATLEEWRKQIVFVHGCGRNA